jgi:hypothetical protein
MYTSMLSLDKVKKLLGITNNDLDEKLDLIIETTETRLMNLLKGDDIPERLQYIVVEVAIVRYNRIGSEGVRIDSVEGESQHYNDSDFEQYLPEIESYLESKNGVEKVRFI